MPNFIYLICRLFILPLCTFGKVIYLSNQHNDRYDKKRNTVYLRLHKSNMHLISIRISLILAIQVWLAADVYGQFIATDTLHEQRWNAHFQTTVIGQWHPAFHSQYAGQNSLVPHEGAKASITSTVYLGLRLWKGAEMYFMPLEQSGLSK